MVEDMSVYHEDLLMIRLIKRMNTEGYFWWRQKQVLTARSTRQKAQAPRMEQLQKRKLAIENEIALSYRNYQT